jgi:phenol 2-monooxygenase
LIVPEEAPTGILRSGELMVPGKLTRYLDANPVDAQLDIPMLGQFRIYFYTPDVLAASAFLSTFCETINSNNSVLGRATIRAAKSYSMPALPIVEADEYIQPLRYIGSSRLFTFATVTTMDRSRVEISDLAPLLQASRWTFYVDDIQNPRTGSTCTEKYLGHVPQGQVAIVNTRPDGYVGAIRCFPADSGAA